MQHTARQHVLIVGSCSSTCEEIRKNFISWYFPFTPLLSGDGGVNVFLLEQLAAFFGSLPPLPQGGPKWPRLGRSDFESWVYWLELDG